ncbi:MAG: efflux transporter outer membrane subunit [Planctomycetota bacterium]
MIRGLAAALTGRPIPRNDSRFALVGVALLLAACVSAPERIEPPLAAPAAWTAVPLASAPGSNDLWWHDFSCAPLNALIEEALAASPTLAAAAARVEGARAAATIAGAELYPDLALEGTVQRQRSQFFAPGAPPRTNRFTLHTLQLSTRWELDVWGRVRAGTQAALADLQSVEAALAGVRLSLIAQVARTYFALTEANGQANNAEANLLVLRALAERIEDRYRLGLRTALDLRLATADLARAEATAVRRRLTVDELRRRLEILVGRYPAGTVTPLLVIPTELPAPPLGLPSELLERRPDIVEAERHVAAQDRRYQQARRAMLPRIALSAAGGYAAQDLADILDKDFGIWNVLGNVFAPLFEGGRLRADVARNQAGLAEALASLAATTLNAFAEVEHALRGEVEYRQLESSLARAVSDSNSALAILVERYFSGVASTLDLLEAQRRLFDSQSALLSAQLAIAVNRVDLHTALGGGYHGYEPPAEESPPAVTVDGDGSVSADGSEATGRAGR